MSLLATRLQNIRVRVPRFDDNMTRQKQYGALDFFAQQTLSPTGFVTPELRERAFGSIGNTVQIPVINYDEDVTVSNVRSCTIEDNDNESALCTVVFATYAVGFTMVPAQFQNNEITYQHDFDRKYEKVMRAMGIKLDQDALAALSTAKTQVYNDKLLYTVTGNVIKAPWDYREDLLGDLNPMMLANGFNRDIHIIGNTGLYSMVSKLAEHGFYNDVNKQLEYMDKIFHFSSQLVNEEGVFATGYAVEDGNVGILTRVDREAYRRARSTNGHEWDVVNVPLLNIEMGTHYYESVGDMSATSGAATADMTCAIKEHFGFSVDVAFVVKYNSAPATVPNPVMAFEVAQSTAANPYAKPVTVVNGETNPVFTKAVTA